MIDRKKMIIISIVAVIGFIFFVLIVISAFTSKSVPPDATSIEPTGTDLLIPTSSQIIPTALPKDEGIQLISTNPPDQSQNIDPIVQISFTFSSPMNEKRFYYKTTPTTPTFIHTQGTTVVITPQSSWPIGANTITVFEASESTDGTKLSTPFQYTFQVSEPSEPIPGTE